MTANAGEVRFGMAVPLAAEVVRFQPLDAFIQLRAIRFFPGERWIGFHAAEQSNQREGRGRLG